MRDVRSVLRAAAVAAALVCAAVPALAQDGAQTPVKVGATDTQSAALPWNVNCSSNPQSGELACTMSQVLIAQDSQQRLIAASIFRQASGSAAIRFSLPHGILLQSGVDVGVDDKPKTNVPIVIADQNGSYAELELSADLLQSLQAGSGLNVGVTAGTGEKVEFSLSLKGFTAAFAKL